MTTEQTSEANVSEASANDDRDTTRDQKARQWRLDNAEAIKEYNARVEKDGLLLAAYRSF